MSNPELATRDTRPPAQILASRVRSDQFQQEVALALPEGMAPRRFVRATVTALLQNPDIAKLEEASIFQSLIRAAQDGLLPDGREAALVAFGQKAQYLPMIGGLRKIAAEHGWSLRTRVVYANDEFDHEEGLETVLRHRPVRTGQERGDLFAAYAVATHRDGRREVEVMYRPDIEKVRKVSRSRGGPWVDWEEQMWEKTVGRRLCKKLPYDPKDAERVTRILDAAALEPEQATALLYGPAPTRTQIEGTPVTSPADDPTGTDPDGGEGQQDGEEPQAAASSSPTPGDEPEPQVGNSFPIPDAVLDEAGATIITKASAESGVKGKTIAEVCGTLEGPAWAAWALAKAPGYYSAAFRTSLELYVQHRLPDVWAAYMDGQS